MVAVNGYCRHFLLRLYITAIEVFKNGLILKLISSLAVINSLSVNQILGLLYGILQRILKDFQDSMTIRVFWQPSRSGVGPPKLFSNSSSV